MYLQHFGLRHAPLGKESTEPWDDGALAQLAQRFNWLLQSPAWACSPASPAWARPPRCAASPGR
jgi:hypothetical protein